MAEKKTYYSEQEKKLHKELEQVFDKLPDMLKFQVLGMAQGLEMAATAYANK